MSAPGPINSNGYAVNMAFPGGVVITGISFYLQSADQSSDANNYRVEDEVGNRVLSAWMDQHQKFTLNGVIKGAGLAAAQAATSLLALPCGTLLVCTSAQALPDIVGTNLEVMSGAKITGSNKDGKTISIPVEKSVFITQVQPS